MSSGEGFTPEQANEFLARGRVEVYREHMKESLERNYQSVTEINTRIARSNEAQTELLKDRAAKADREKDSERLFGALLAPEESVFSMLLIGRLQWKHDLEAGAPESAEAQEKREDTILKEVRSLIKKIFA